MRLLLYKFINLFYKSIYNLLLNYYVCNLIKFIYIILNLLIILIYEINGDLNLLYINYNELKVKLKNFSILKFLSFTFLFILGILPLIIFVYFIFYFIKYIFKYIFLILDLYFNEDNIHYNNIKNKIFNIIETVPLIIDKVYIFLFKSNWTKYFIKLLLKYLESKKNIIVRYIFKKFDKFILIYLPRIYYNLKDKITDDYRISSIIYYYRIKKYLLVTLPWYIKVFFFKIYKKIHLYIYKKYFYKSYMLYQLISIKCARIYLEIYYYIKFKYTFIKFYLIWFLKVFIRSDAFVMTVEAFFKLNYFRSRAYLIYISMHIYYNISYIVIINIYYILYIIYQIVIYFNIYLFDFKCWINEKIKYKYSFKICVYLSILYHLFILWVIVLLKTHWWIDFKNECYFLEYGDRSQSWWNLKLYSVVIKFFSRAYITNLYLHTLRWKKIIYIARYYYWAFSNFKYLTYDILYYTWHHLILRKPFKKVEFKWNRFE